MIMFGGRELSLHGSTDQRTVDWSDMTFFHPDCTVGSGVSPDHTQKNALAGYTADRELILRLMNTDQSLFGSHPAPKVKLFVTIITCG